MAVIAPAVDRPSRPSTPPRTEAPKPGRRASARPSRSQLRLETLEAWLASTHWTEKAYFALPESNLIVELSDGQLVIPDLPTRTHQELVGSLYLELSVWNRTSQRGVVLLAPYRIRLWRGKIREPDVMFYLAEHADRAKEQRGGPPDLAVDVLSPSTRDIDRGDKFAEYARAGVQEYWLVDPDAEQIEVCVLESGSYQLQGRYVPGDQAPSRLLPGFTVDVAALFKSASRAAPPSGAA